MVARGVYEAASIGDGAALRRLLEQSTADINQTKDGETALHIAVKKENIEVLQILLEYKANLDAADRSGNTPLNIAVQYDLTHIAAFLLQQKANMQQENFLRDTPLESAVRYNRGQSVKLLLGHGSRIRSRAVECAKEVRPARELHEYIKYCYAGWTPLHVAVMHKNRDACQLFVNLGFTFNDHSTGEVKVRQGGAIWPLKFGHGTTPADVAEKMKVTSLLSEFVQGPCTPSRTPRRISALADYSPFANQPFQEPVSPMPSPRVYANHHSFKDLTSNKPQLLTNDRQATAPPFTTPPFTTHQVPVYPPIPTLPASNNEHRAGPTPGNFVGLTPGNWRTMPSAQHEGLFIPTISQLSQSNFPEVPTYQDPSNGGNKPTPYTAQAPPRLGGYVDQQPDEPEFFVLLAQYADQDDSEIREVLTKLAPSIKYVQELRTFAVMLGAASGQVAISKNFAKKLMRPLIQRLRITLTPDSPKAVADCKYILLKCQETGLISRQEEIEFGEEFAQRAILKKVFEDQRFLMVAHKVSGLENQVDGLRKNLQKTATILKENLDNLFDALKRMQKVKTYANVAKLVCSVVDLVPIVGVQVGNPLRAVAAVIESGLSQNILEGLPITLGMDESMQKSLDIGVVDTMNVVGGGVMMAAGVWESRVINQAINHYEQLQWKGMYRDPHQCQMQYIAMHTLMQAAALARNNSLSDEPQADSIRWVFQPNSGKIPQARPPRSRTPEARLVHYRTPGVYPERSRTPDSRPRASVSPMHQRRSPTTQPPSPGASSASGVGAGGGAEPRPARVSQQPQASHAHDLVDGLPLFSREELEAEMNGFDRNFNKVEDLSGTMYRFEVRYTKHLVKVYKDMIDRKEFIDQVVGAAKLRHQQIVQVFGICPELRCVIFEDMPSGSLESWLNVEDKRKNLSFVQRVWILLDVCNALLFLHHKHTPVYHKGIWPQNILLDRSKRAKLMDAMLSDMQSLHQRLKSRRSLEKQSKSVLVFLDPEYISSGMSGPSTDVYGLGMTMLQMFTGRHPRTNIRDELKNALDSSNTRAILDLVDPTLVAPPEHAITNVLRLAMQCTEANAALRPPLAPSTQSRGYIPVISKLRHVENMLGQESDASQLWRLG